MKVKLLTELSWSEVAELERTRCTVVMPIASIEQHGYHLPVSTDLKIMEYTVEALIRRGAEFDRQYLVLPILPFGLSPEHLNFPGTVSLGSPALTTVLRDMLSSMVHNGFLNFMFLNTHGGNSPFLVSVARELRLELSCTIDQIDLYSKAFFSQMQSVLEGEHVDIHAGEYETSLLLHLCPDCVRVDRMEVTNLSSLPNAWLTEELSASGVLGDPTLATAEKGEALFAYLVDNLEGLWARR